MEPGLSFAELDLGSDERFQRLRADLGVSSFGINLMRLQPGQGGRIHAHAHQEEVYLVLEGRLTLEVEGSEEHELGRGQLVRVAPGVRRRLSNRRAEPLALLALGGAQPHEGRDGRAYLSWEETEGRSPQDVPLPDDLPVRD